MIRKLGWLIILFVLFGLSYPQCANAAELNWIWYYSSDYVSEYYSPESLKIVKDYNGNIDHIEIWTKTTYSQAGAEDTIDSYDLTNVPNIYQLSYSMAKIYIKPHSRQIVWQNEIFYNNEGNSLWSKEKDKYELDWEEAYPNSSNERYFSVVCDQVFHNGQPIDFEKWKTGKDRWVGLSQSNNNDGTVISEWFDNVSLRVDNDIITYWVYYEKRQEGSVLSRFYIKEALNRKEQKIKTIGFRVKDKNGEWKYRNAVDSHWKTTIPGSVGEHQVSIITQYVDSNIIENLKSIPTPKETKSFSDKFPFN